MDCYIIIRRRHHTCGRFGSTSGQVLTFRVSVTLSDVKTNFDDVFPALYDLSFFRQPCCQIIKKT